MKKSTVIAIPSSYIVITTLVYTIPVATTFFEIDDNALRGENFDDDKTLYTQQQVVEKPCKSPCPSTAEMCIAMCA